MITKSYIAEQNINSLNENKIVLFYGENQGLKKDFKNNLKTINKNSEILNYFQDEILKDENLLISEIKNKSLFDKEKIIFIDHTNDKIFEVIENVLKDIDKEKIFIFADILDRKSKMRNFFEKSKDLVCIPCYQDNEITIKKIITSRLNKYQGLNSELINIIVKNCGLDRNKINNEIDKIVTCFEDKKIDLNKLEQLLNLKTNDDFNLLKDEALNGNKINTNRLLADTVFELENNIYYLNSINQRINKLKQIDKLKKDNKNIEYIIGNLKPPIFWKDKPRLIEQSKKWNKIKIDKALEKTYKTEVKLKSNSTIKKDLLIKKLIIELCSSASSA